MSLVCVILLCMSNTELTHFGRELQKYLERRGWSRRRLAEEAGVDVSTVSRMMRGIQQPTHKTVQLIADALEVDPFHLKRIAGLRVQQPRKARNPSVEYLAQRLDDLPPEIQEQAIEALGAQLDVIYNIMKLSGVSGS
ncbi:MAG: helix-turn-helix domain-containing protein [Ardenticatenaceae bacterium]